MVEWWNDGVVEWRSGVALQKPADRSPLQKPAAETRVQKLACRNPPPFPPPPPSSSSSVGGRVDGWVGWEK